MTPKLILASTSSFRKSILEKLKLPFIQMDPVCDETPYIDETPQELVQRLALEKAKSVITDSVIKNGVIADKENLVIGSDQVCVINGHIIGKPKCREKAIQQLQNASGQVITFYTGLALYHSSTGKYDVRLDTFKVHFRSLTTAQIEYYVDKERPFNCAGSFMSEGLGIALFKKLQGDDPNSLVGLPLITLINMLQGFDIDVLQT